MEFINRYKPQDRVFGIAEVETESCKLTIGYYLAEHALTLLQPHSCQSCRKMAVCNREFGAQIIQKYNQKHEGQETYYLL